MRMAQKLIALDLNDETDQTPTREERAAQIIAERLLANGAKSLTRQEHTRPGIVERTPEHLRAHLGRTSSSNAATWSRGFEQKERSLSRLISV